MGQDVNAKLAQLLLDREAKLRRIDFTGTVNAHIGGHGGLAAERSVIRRGSHIPLDGASCNAGRRARNTGEGISSARSHARYAPRNPGHSNLGVLDHLEPVVQTRLEQGAILTILAICQAGFKFIQRVSPHGRS